MSLIISYEAWKPNNIFKVPVKYHSIEIWKKNVLLRNQYFNFYIEIRTYFEEVYAAPQIFVFEVINIKTHTDR